VNSDISLKSGLVSPAESGA